MLFQNLKAIGEEISEICVLYCKYIYIFIYIDKTLFSYLLDYLLVIYVTMFSEIGHVTWNGKIVSGYCLK
jgi:hypothetical protein